MKRYRQKFFSIFSIFLLTLSLVVPQQAVARNENPDEDIDDEELEKELEAVMEEENGESNEHPDPESAGDGLIGMQDGLDFDEDPSYDEDEFVLDGKVETDIMDQYEEESKADVIIHLKDKADMKHIADETAQMEDKAEKTAHVAQSLKEKAESTQSDLMQTLDSMEADEAASDVKSFWVFNGIAATLDEDALEKLAERDDVKRITMDAEIKAPEFEPEESEPRLPEYGVEKINAPDVWGEYDERGQGTVVGIMDTGVEKDHEALQDNYRGRDGSDESSWADFSGEEYDEPADGQGHGTHVAGTAVGGGDGEPVGVAPDAEWIAAKIFDDGGAAQTSGIHEAFEWFMEPGGDPDKAPDVVNNSWGNGDSYETEFLEDVKAWISAGIFPLFAAGNDGPGSETIGSPGSFPEAFSVGATDEEDQVTGFSSRGPVYWEDDDGEEKRYTKPEISAPGDDIYSSLPDGDYGLNSGTSMATPHVAGAVALIKASNPDMTEEEIMDLLNDTARTEEFMGELPNDDYGHGITDVYQAVTESTHAGELKGTLTDAEGEPISGELYMEDEDLRIEIDDDGEFDLKVREGEHEVDITSFGYASKTETIEIVKDEVLEKDWTLDASEQYNVSGNVQFADGDPAAFAYVRVEDAPVDPSRTDENGDYEIPDLPEGEYTLVISGKGIEATTVTIEVDDDITRDVEVDGIAVEAEEDWTTSRNDFSRNAVTEADVSAENLELDWSVEVPTAMLFNSPVIAEGKVVYATDNGKVKVVDQQSGEEDWSVRTGASNRSTPTVKDGIVYVGGGGDSSFHAISLETGKKEWSADLDYPAVYETPVVEDDVVYISSHMEEGAKVLALDAEDGDVIWEQDIGDGSFYGPLMGDDTLYASTYDSHELYALSPEDGEVKWDIQLDEEGFSSSPIYDDGVLYANTNDIDGESGSLRAFDASSGEELWKSEDIGNAEAGAPIVYDDMVLTGSETYPTIKAFNTSTGEKEWEADNGSPMSNSGAVSGNGHLFVTDASSALKVYDVFTGDRIASYNLDSRSTSGVAITDGQVVAADNEKVYSFTSPGELSGTVTDEDDNPLDAKISIPDTEQSADTDGDGQYSLEGSPGTYEAKVASYGYKQIEEEVEFISGHEQTKDYQLEEAKSGSFSGKVIDDRTEEPLEGVSIEVKDTDLEMETDNDGEFDFPEVYEGTYDVALSLGGYDGKTSSVTIDAGENTEEALELDPVDVAVLHDMEDEDIVRFLNDNDFVAEERDWDVIDDIDDYEAVVLNGAYTPDGDRPTEEQINDIIDAAGEEDVSLLFAGTWGPSFGSLEYLAEHTDDPAEYGSAQGTVGNTHMRVDNEHPIFDGLDEDSTHLAIDQPYLSWFNQYSGRTIGSVGTGDDGITGSGVAYKAVTEDSAHLLMSTHATSPWVSPYLGWTSAQQDVYLNGIDYLLEDTQFGKLSGTINDSDGKPLEDVTVTAEDSGVSVETDEDGKYELYHDEGEENVSFQKSGYSTETSEVTFTYGEPIEENLELSESGSGSISGKVIDTETQQEISGAAVTVYDEDDEEVAEDESSSNGNYEITGLDEAGYTLNVEEEDFVIYEESVDVADEPVEKEIELYPEPALGIIGDEIIGSLGDELEEKGIEAKDYDGMEDAMEELEDLDVVFFNAESLSDDKKKVLEDFMIDADDHEVSVIFGDDYYDSSALNHLVKNRNDPEKRIRERDRESQAGYVVNEENPVFGDAEEDDFIPILTPDASSVSAFEDYSGYPLAEIKHDGDDEPHGTGVAYKPRTEGSMELLMGGHGVSTSHRADDYTKAGMDMFRDAILHAAYIEYNAIEGTVTDEDGDPIDATAKLVDNDMEKETDPKTGDFSLGSLDGEFDLLVDAFGYDTYTTTVTVDDDIEPLDIEMTPEDDNGAIEGTIVDEDNGEGIEDADVDLVGQPRGATSDVRGSFELDTLEPGDYTLTIEKDDYVTLDVDVAVEAGETKTIDEDMKPTPTVGVIVDSQSSSAFTLDEYLTSRGYDVEEFYYTDLDEVGDVDLVFANSDYDKSLIPEEDAFRDFLNELDETETPVIWTGNNGPRGSIRFLEDYIGDPEEEHTGKLSSDEELIATVTDDHPIMDGVDLDDDEEFTFPTGYYAGFEGYTGETIADVSSEETGDLGALVGYGGRTLNSNEVLLETMTFGYGFSEDEYFDENREKIVNNAITWALDDHDPLVGEIHGQVTNDMEGDVAADITVEETGYTFETEDDGSFFLGLDDGTYTLAMEAFGHEDERFEVTVEQGEAQDEEFTMASDDAGTVDGEIRSEADGEAVEGAAIELEGTPLETTSDEDGSYEIQAPEDEYQMRITAEGYAPQVVDVAFESDETETVDVEMQDPEDIAFVGSSKNEDRALPFLDEQGYEVDFVDDGDLEELMDELDDYSLIIWNDNEASEETSKEFIEKADEEAVSIIFAGQWKKGTIRDLTGFYDDPREESSSDAPEYVDYKVLEEHPIFNGYEEDETIKIADRGDSNQQYHVFDDYSGTTIGDLEHFDEGTLGSAVAYDYRSADNVHVLLDTLHIGMYGNPDERWTEDAKNIYVNAIDWALSANLGEISGTVDDADGEGIEEATVSIESEDEETTTNDKGEYSLGVGQGEYEVKAEASGYESETETVEVEDIDDVVELDFELESTDRATLAGTVTEGEEDGLEDVSVTLEDDSGDFEETEETDDDGKYAFTDLVAGGYDITIEAKGYKTIKESIALEEGEDTTKDIQLSAFDIAVLGDHKSSMTDFLTDHDAPAQDRDWDIVDDVYNYDAIIVNSGEGDEEELETLIDEADEYETSLIFTDTWGPDGSIGFLEEVFGSPEHAEQGYDEGAVYIDPDDDDHDIFDGFDDDDIKIHGEKSPYATFKNYDGITLASLSVDGEDKGDAIAYTFQGENHMHMMMSSYAVNNIIGPEEGWTSDGEDLFLQAVEWAKDGEQESPDTPEWTSEGPIITDEDTVKVEGKAEYQSDVEIIGEDDDVLAEATPDHDDTFEVELSDLEDDHYDLTLQASNHKGDSEAEETLEMIVDTTDPELHVDQPEDDTATNDRLIHVKGTVTDDNLEEVLVNGNEASVDDDDIFHAELALDKGEHTITVSASDIAGNESETERTITIEDKKELFGLISQTAPEIRYNNVIKSVR